MPMAKRLATPLRFAGCALLVAACSTFALLVFQAGTSLVRVDGRWVFAKIDGRTKSSECRSNLKDLFTEEKANFADHSRYTTHLNDIGFEPERGNRYAYFISRKGPVEERKSTRPPVEDRLYRGVDRDVFKYGEPGISADQVPMTFRGVPVGITGECPHCEFLAVCAGQLDSDPALDVWTISSRDRAGPDGGKVPAGTPVREINDEHERTMPTLPPIISANDD